MDTVLTAIAGVAGLVIVAMLSWLLLVGWRRIMIDDAPLPFFPMLGRQGLDLDGINKTSKPGDLARAVRRCAMCEDKECCTQRLASGESDDNPYCPNEKFFNEVKRA